MSYILLLILIIISIEIIIKSNYIFLFKSLIKIILKAKNIIFNKYVSDHWKEKIIPEYSLQMLKISFSMLLIFSLIVLLFLVTDKFFSELLEFIFSIRGIILSILFGFSYIYLKNLLENE